MESTIFLARHISGVIDVVWPCLYEETSFLAFSRPEDETRRVLRAPAISYYLRSKANCDIPTTP